MFRHALGKILTLSIFLILAVGVAFYIHEQNRPAQEPIRIYKATTPAPKPVKSATSQRVEVTPTEVPTFKNPHAGHNHPPHDYNHNTHEEKTLPIEIPVADTTNNTSPTPEEPQSRSDEEIEKWVTSVREMLEDLDRRFMEKYPEALQISSMTKEEFFEAYPTPESQQALADRMERIQPEIFAELRAVYSALPIEIVDDILSSTKERLIQTMGYDTADLLIRQLRRELGL